MVRGWIISSGRCRSQLNTVIIIPPAYMASQSHFSFEPKTDDRFFFKNEKVENGMVEVSEFRAMFGWAMSCVVWPIKVVDPSFILPQIKINRNGFRSVKC